MNDFSLFAFLLCNMILLRVFWALTDPRSVLEHVQWHFQPHILKNTVIEIAVVILLAASILFLPLPMTRYDDVIRLIGLLIFFTGYFLAIWSKMTLKKNWGPAEDPRNTRRQTQLITSGPYTFSRNPMYLAFVMTTLGIFLTLRSYLIVLCIFHFLYFYTAALREEKVLAKIFGRKFAEYKKRTPRFLFF